MSDENSGIPMVNQQLLQKFVLGDVSDEEAAKCEAFLEANDSATFELDTDVEFADTVIRSLRQDHEVDEGGNDDYSELTRDIEIQLHRRLETEDIAKFLRPPQSEDEIGRIGEYRVLERIGSGGMGIVFRVESSSGEISALKLMNPLIASNPQAAERFQREVRSAAALDHRLIVKIRDVGVDMGIPFFTMDLLKGSPLSSVCPLGQKIPAARICRYAAQIAEALEYAGKQGILHRDIKPDNLWIDQDDQIVILDFGLARGLDESVGLTRTGDVLGTPKYMAPEQITGEAVDQRADLFSLGAVVYEWLTGVSKFANPNVYSTMMAITQQEVTVGELLKHDCPRGLADLVVRLLKKAPADRPQTATEVKIELQKLIEQQNVETVKTPEVSSSRNNQRPRWPAFFAGFLLAFAGFLTGIVIYQATDRGTLVIEAEEGVEVTTGKDRIQIRLIDSDKTYQVRLGENRLPSGAYEIVINEKGSDFSFSTDRFAIRRGGKRLVQISSQSSKGSDSNVNERANSRAPNYFDSKILNVSEEKPGYFSIGIGKDDGVKVGTVVEIYRGNQFIGLATLLAANDSQSTAMIDRSATLSVRKGDSVALRRHPRSPEKPENRIKTTTEQSDLENSIGVDNIDAKPDPNSGRKTGKLNHLPALPIAENLGIKPGQTLSEQSMVSNPPTLNGLESFGIETRYHRAPITDLELNQNHEMLAVGGQDSVVRIWKWDSSNMMSAGSMSDADPSIDGSGSSPFDKKLLHILPCVYPVHLVSWSPVGDVLAISAIHANQKKGMLTFWRVTKSKVELIQQINGVVNDFCWSPYGNRIAARVGENIMFFDMSTNKLKPLPNRGIKGRFTKRAWSKEGLFAVSVPASGAKEYEVVSGAPVDDVVVWDLSLGQTRHTIRFSQSAGFFDDAKGETLMAVLGYSNDGKDLRVPVKIYSDHLLKVMAEKMLMPKSRLHYSTGFNGFLAIEPKDWRVYETEAKILGFQGRYFGDEKAHEWPREVYTYKEFLRSRKYFPLAVDFRWNICDDRDQGLTDGEVHDEGEFQVLTSTQAVSGDYVRISIRYFRDQENHEGSESENDLYRFEANMTRLSDGKTKRIMTAKAEGRALPSPLHFQVSPDGKKLVYVNMERAEGSGRSFSSSKWKHTLQVLDLTSFQIWKKTTRSRGQFRAIPRWMSDGRYLVVANDYAPTELEVFDPINEKTVGVISKQPARDNVVVGDRNHRILFGTQHPNWLTWSHSGNTVAIFDVETQKIVKEVSPDFSGLIDTQNRRNPRVRIRAYDWHEAAGRIVMTISSDHFPSKMVVQTFDINESAPKKISDIEIRLDREIAHSNPRRDRYFLYFDQVNISKATMIDNSGAIRLLDLEKQTSQRLVANSPVGPPIPPMTESFEVESSNGRFFLVKTQQEFWSLDVKDFRFRQLTNLEDSLSPQQTMIPMLAQGKWTASLNRLSSVYDRQLKLQGSFVQNRKYPLANEKHGAWITHEGRIHLLDESMRKQLRVIQLRGKELRQFAPDENPEHDYFQPLKKMPPVLTR